MGVHLGDCNKEKDLFLLDGCDSEKKSDGSPSKGLDMPGIAEWLSRQFQFHDNRAVDEVASCIRVNQS